MGKLRKISIYVDSDDMALIKQAAKRRGVPESEILREGIRLAAMSERVWEEEPTWPVLDSHEL